jgi:O-antigen/teichoic acid export membrane protein
VLANGLATIASTGLALAKKSMPVTVAVSIAAVVSVALNFVLIPSLGKAGAAWASAISWTVYAAFLFFRAQKIHPLPYDFRRAAIAGLLLIAIVLVAPRVSAGSVVGDVFLKLAAGAIFVGVLFSVALPGWPGMLRRALRPAH